MTATAARKAGTALGTFALLVATATTSSAATFTLIDGEGFEAPAYSTAFLGSGQLEGQLASTFEGSDSVQWLQNPPGGPGTAVVQTDVVASGSQAVEVNRAASSDDRWAVPITAPTALPLVCVEWDMLVEETPSQDATFGPFFGIEAYHDDGDVLLRIGTLGVDAKTAEVLYVHAVGGLQPTGALVNFGEWNHFRMVLDFSSDQYYGFVNDAMVVGGAFESPGADQFTDADIAALAAFGDAASQAAVGTAYFDNYNVFETNDFSKIPEPSSIFLAGLAVAILACQRSIKRL